MEIKLAILLILSFYIPGVLSAQSDNSGNIKSKNIMQVYSCYDDRPDTSNVFTKTEVAPKYKGRGGFENYLTERSGSAMLLSAIGDKFFTDTVFVKFILKPGAQKMSDLTLTESKNKSVGKQLAQAIKESACLWTPGSFSGVEVQSWFSFKIYYSVVRQQNNVSLNVGYQIINKWNPNSLATWKD